MNAAVTVKDLAVRLGGRSILDRLDMNVPSGAIYGCLGPNGSGKTTALRTLLGLLRPERGAITVLGEVDPLLARRSVGALIDVPAFPAASTGRDALADSARLAGIPAAEVPAEVDRVARRVGLAERTRDATDAYSLGMRQRLGLARALLGRPRLLILDEPTNGLDPAGMRDMRDLVRSLAHDDQLTVLLSSHNLAEVQATCTHVGVLRGGRLVAEGPVAGLLDRPETEVEVGGDTDAIARALADVDGATWLGPVAPGRGRIRLHGWTVPVLVRRLVERNIDVTAVVPDARSLEDAYLELTR